MKTYVISFINFFDNELVSEIVRSDKMEVEVLKEYLFKGQEADNEDLKNLNTIEECKEYCFDSDSMCNIIEVPKD